MSRLVAWIKAHPVASFLLLTLAAVYVLLFPAVLFGDSVDDQPLVGVLLFYGARLGVYAPVLVGMLLVRWFLPNRSPVSTGRRWVTLGIVWLVALVVFVLEVRNQMTEIDLGLGALVLLSAPVALLPAYVVSGALSRVTAVREHLSTLVSPRGHLVWYLVALFTFPLFYITGQVITQFLAGEPLLSNVQPTPDILQATLVTFAFVFFYAGGINEEGGWRGFAQRHLQKSYSPLTANLFLYLYLVVVHVPNDIVQYEDGGYLLYRITIYPFTVILFGWVYNRTQGSILAPALFHASMNSMNILGDAIPGTPAAFVLLILFATYAVVSDRMWQKLPPDQTISKWDSGQPSLATPGRP
jgi:membrane protease YdiL (CAAX protease family)